MKNIFKAFLLIGIGLIIGLILNCGGRDNVPTTTITTVDTIPGDTVYTQVSKWDTIEVKEFVYIDKPDTILDTVYIINEFYSKYWYSDTVTSLDSSVIVVINDTLYKNSIFDRSVFIRNKRPTTIIANTNIYEYNKLWLTGTIMPSDKIAIGIGIDYTAKKHSVGLSLFSNKSLTINYKYNIIRFK